MDVGMSLYDADEGVPVELKAGDTMSPNGMDVRVAAIHKDRVVLVLTRTATRITAGECPYCGTQLGWDLDRNG